MRSAFAGRWVAFAAVTIVGAAGFTLAGLHGGAADWALVRIFGLAVLYSACIGVPSTVLLPPLGHRLGDAPVVRGTLLFLAAGLLVAVLGAAIATTLLTAFDVFAVADYRRNLAGAAVVSAVLGVPTMSATYAYSRFAHRLTRERQAHAEAERIAAEARFSSLSSRLQPHFLFNALNSIAALVREDPRRAEQLVQRLSSLLRSSLDTSVRKLVRLRDELDLVTDYLELEQARFGERLRFELDVPAALDDAGVPPFTLQSLVENCVKHAIAPRRDGGWVRVSAREHPGELVLEVCDDGPGLRGPMREGHGLDVLARRLQSLFGGRAALEPLRVDGPAGVATVIRVTLPRVRAVEDAA